MVDSDINLDSYKIPSKQILQYRQEFYDLWRRSDDETMVWLKRVLNCIRRCDYPKFIAELLLIDRFICGLVVDELESLQSVYSESWTLNQLLDRFPDENIVISDRHIESIWTDDDFVNQNENPSLDVVKSEPIEEEEELFQFESLNESPHKHDPFAEPNIIKDEHILEDNNTVSDAEETNSHLSAVIDGSYVGKQNKKTQRRKRKRDLNTTHPKEKRSFPCDECDKSFSHGSHLLQHKKCVHRKILAYICEQCGKRFSRGSHLNRHSITHTGERSYACDECDKSFPLKSNLARHKMSVHRGIRSHACQECGKSFIGAFDLQRHLRVHTKTTTSETVGM